MKKSFFKFGLAAAMLSSLLFTGCPKEPAAGQNNKQEEENSQEKFTINLDIDLAAKKAGFGEVTVTSDSTEFTMADGIITLSPKEEGVEFEISGYFNGQIVNNTKNTILKLNNAFIENTAGDPAILSSQKLEISTAADSENFVVSSSKNAAIYCYDAVKDKSKNLELGGSGICYVYGTGKHGIKADEIKVKGSGVYYASGASSAYNCNTFVIGADKTVTVVAHNSTNGIKADNENNQKNSKKHCLNRLKSLL